MEGVIKFNGEYLELSKIDPSRLVVWIDAISNRRHLNIDLGTLHEFLVNIRKMTELFITGTFTNTCHLLFSVQGITSETEESGIDVYDLTDDQFRLWTDAIGNEMLCASTERYPILSDLHQELQKIASLYIETEVSSCK